MLKKAINQNVKIVFWKYIFLYFYFLILVFSYYTLNKYSLLNLEMYSYSFQYSKFIISLFAVFFIGVNLPSVPNKPSHYFIWLHAAFPIIPLAVFYSYSGCDTFYFLFILAVFLIVRYLSRLNYRPKALLNFNTSPLVIVWSFTILLLLLIALGGNYSGIEYSFDFVYENRILIAESQSSYFEYAHTIISKGLLPFLLLYYFLKRDWLLFCVVLLISLSIYFLSQHRAALFYPFLAIICYFAAQYSRKLGGGVFLLAFSCVILFALLLVQFRETLLVGDLLIRRSYFAPAILNYEYYKFFLENPYTYFSDSKISMGLIEPIYSIGIPYLISDEVGLLGGHANAGYLGSGFQQAGYVGVILYAAIISYTLKILDSLGERISNSPFIFAVCSPPLFWLINSSDLPGVFITHGLLVSIMILSLSVPHLKNCKEVTQIDKQSIGML